MEKSWWQSKTVWFMALSGLIAVAQMFGFVVTEQHLPHDWHVVITAVVGIILRLRTRAAIK